MAYRIEYTKSAVKDVAALDPQVRRRVLRAIDDLAENPRQVGAIQLKGSKHWRIRVGDYRVIYDINDGKLIVLVLRVRHRGEVYD